MTGVITPPIIGVPIQFGSIYATKVTPAYLNRRAAAEAGGTAINFAAGTVIVGDGNGSVPPINDLLTNNGVLHEVWRGQIVQSVTVNDVTPSEIDILCVIPPTDGLGADPPTDNSGTGFGAEIGPFWIREFAITDENGVVMVVGTTQLEKTTGASNGQISDLAFVAAIGESNTSTVILTPPAAGWATTINVYNIVEEMAATAQEPIYRIDTVSNGKHYHKFAVRTAPQDITKLGVTRPATDAEFSTFTPDPASLTSFPYPTLHQIQTLLQNVDPGLLHSGTDTGAANAYVLTTTVPSLKAYTFGVTLIFVPTHASTGADCTIDANGLGPVALKGGNGTTTVGKGHLAVGMPVIAWFDGTRFRVVYSGGMNPQSTRWFVGSAAAEVASVNQLYITFTGPSPAARSVGVNMRVKITTTPNTGPVVMNYGFGDIPLILNSGGSALVGGELTTNLEAIIFDDGTNLRLVNPAQAAITFPGALAPLSRNDGANRYEIANASSAAVGAGRAATDAEFNAPTGIAAYVWATLAQIAKLLRIDLDDANVVNGAIRFLRASGLGFLRLAGVNAALQFGTPDNAGVNSQVDSDADGTINVRSPSTGSGSTALVKQATLRPDGDVYSRKVDAASIDSGLMGQAIIDLWARPVGIPAIPNVGTIVMGSNIFAYGAYDHTFVPANYTGALYAYAGTWRCHGCFDLSKYDEFGSLINLNIVYLWVRIV